MIDKIIKGKIIEIAIVSIFVIVSVPIWQGFEKKISQANVTTLADYNLKYSITNNNGLEIINVLNKYYINKNYKILLRTSKDIDIRKSKIVINGITHFMDDFNIEKKGGYYTFTIISDYITADNHEFIINTKFAGDNIYYTYILEENSNF